MGGIDVAYTEIGKNIQATRTQKKMSRETLAELSGLSANFIGNIERGEKALSLESFISIANALGVSADTLLGNVLNNSYQVKSSILCEQINSLSPKKRTLVHELLEILLKDKE